MKQEQRKFDLETVSVFLILSVLTGAFLFGMRLVLFAPSYEMQNLTPTEIRGQKAP